MDVLRAFFALVRSAVCGTQLTDTERNSYSNDLLQNLFEISSKHDVAHLVAFGLKRNGLISVEKKDIEKYILKAVYRYERIEYEYKNFCTLLEKAQIPFIPLKGSVIRKYYPEAWMRTSCDIDVLVHEADLERATACLIEERYTLKCKNSHDVSFFAPNGTHLELHYDLIEDSRSNAAPTVLEKVWEFSTLSGNSRYRYEMSDEMFYFYHIAHMAKHFEYGGCGVRPFIDIWILNHRINFEKEKRDELLADGKLLVFAKQVELLSEIWFETAEHTEITLQMQDYILNGGVYGSRENLIIVQQQKKGGKLKYAFSRLFLPYDTIKYQFPILGRRKWLTPVMEVLRWIKLIFGGRFKSAAKELKYNRDVLKETAEQTRDFLNKIGLGDE